MNTLSSQFMRVILLVLISMPLATVALAETVADRPKVRLSSLEWAPYIGSDMTRRGYVYELVKTAYDRQGYDVDIIFYPWARALRLAQAGEVSGLMPEYYDASREADFAFSEPFPGGPVGFYKRKSSSISFPGDPVLEPHKTFRKMKDYRFGVVRGYINTRAFDEADFLTKDEAVSDEINLRKLFHERVDLIFIDQHVARYLINNLPTDYNQQLEFMSPALENKSLYIAFSRKARDYEQHLEAFNQGLSEMQSDGGLEDILARHGFPDNPGSYQDSVVVSPSP